VDRQIAHRQQKERIGEHSIAKSLQTAFPVETAAAFNADVAALLARLIKNED